MVHRKTVPTSKTKLQLTEVPAVKSSQTNLSARSLYLDHSNETFVIKYF